MFLSKCGLTSIITLNKNSLGYSSQKIIVMASNQNN